MRDNETGRVGEISLVRLVRDHETKNGRAGESKSARRERFV